MIGETVTILRGQATIDRYGNTTVDWTTPTRTDIDGVAVAPRTSGEEHAGRTAVIVGLTLYLPAGADMRATDRVVARGSTYEVVGDPAVWVSPYTGAQPGIEVAVERYDG